MTTPQMLSELMHRSGPRPQTARQLSGGVRELFGVNVSRKEVKRALFAEQILFPRAGSTNYLHNDDARLDRLVQELFGANR